MKKPEQLLKIIAKPQLKQNSVYQPNKAQVFNPKAKAK